MKLGKVPANTKGRVPKLAANIQPRVEIANPSLGPIGSSEELNFLNRKPLRVVMIIERIKALITDS